MAFTSVEHGQNRTDAIAASGLRLAAVNVEVHVTYLFEEPHPSGLQRLSVAVHHVHEHGVRLVQIQRYVIATEERGSGVQGCGHRFGSIHMLTHARIYIYIYI